MKALFKYTALAASIAAAHASALPVYNTDSSNLDLAIEGGLGYFSSQENYATGFAEEDGGSNWQEGYFKVGLNGDHSLGNSSVYGGLSVSATATTGDGDAAGFTNGEERRMALENAFVGWKSGSTIEALGENGLDISFGRQSLVIGDGFLVNGDGLSFGDSAEDVIDVDLGRGGAYWMGGSARSAFAKTLVVRVGGDSGLRADLFKVGSNNRPQGETELTGVNLEYVGEQGTVGLLRMKSESDGSYAIASRDGMNTTSLRYQGSAGVENLFLSAEFAHQKNDDVVGRAGYVEAGWTFADVNWSPSLNYRYASFDENFDPLFYGFNRGYGTWFQGEVAGSYAGPFNSNTDVHHVALKASVNESLHLGALFFDFSDHEKTAGVDNGGREIDLYAEYFLNENMLVSPLVGIYTPNESAENGGTQMGSDDTNLYAQVGFYFFY